MLTVQELLVNTPSEVIKKSRKVRADITSVKKVQRNGKTFLEFNMKGRAITDKVYYDLTILIYTARKKNKNPNVLEYEKPDKFSPVWVRCTCPYFMFYVEWVLAKEESTTLRRTTDNKPPNIKNPQRIPYVCKHLYRALPLALDVTKKIP